MKESTAFDRTAWAKSSLLGALLGFVVSVLVGLVWPVSQWPGRTNASALGFFLTMGAFFSWSYPRLKASSWIVKVLYALVVGLPPALLVILLNKILLGR